MIWKWFHLFPRNCLNLISLDILSMGWNVMAQSTETWVDLSLWLTCTGRVASAKVLWHSNFSLSSSVTSGNVFSQMHLGCKQIFIYPRNSTHTLQNTPEMVLGVKAEGGGALAENIRDGEEFRDKQRKEGCLSVFLASKSWKGLAWQISTLAAYQGHFGELEIKQRSLRHRESELVTLVLTAFAFSRIRVGASVMPRQAREPGTVNTWDTLWARYVQERQPLRKNQVWFSLGGCL